MKKSIYYLILCCLFVVSIFPFELDAQTSKNKENLTHHTLMIEGVEREFYIYTPSKVSSANPLPVVFGYHGSGGNGQRFLKLSGWVPRAEQEEILLVFPTAVQYCISENGKEKSLTKWNDGKLEGYACAGQYHYDDVLFFRKMLDYVQQKYTIDKGAIYATGFSNGGNFVSRLTMEASDVLKATGMVGGGLQIPVLEDPVSISSILVMGGADKNLFEKIGGEQPLDKNLVKNPAIHEVIKRIIQSLGLPDSPKFKQNKFGVEFTYQGEATTHQFRFYVIKDMEHIYPNGKNHALDITEPLWQFFQQIKSRS